VLQISGAPSEPARERSRTAFEETFNSFLDHDRGIWESLNETSFVMAFWDFPNEEKASRLLVSLKNKLSSALKADILTGVAKFPFHDFTETQTLANALKAIDHAAFFGPDTLIHFDGVSLNISGDRLYQVGRFDAAIKEYRKGLEIKPGDINLINSLGVCFGVMGKLELAKKEFETAAAINPNEVMVIYNIGLIYRIEGDLDKAVMYLRKAHGIDDQVFEVELVLGLLLFKKGDPDQAMPHLEAATRINPKSGLAFRIRGDIYLLDKLPEQAALEFNRAIKLNPSDAVSLSGYAKSLALQEKNLNIALTFARNSIALEPDNTLFRKRFKIIQEKIDAATLQDDHIKTA
jgi:tetratricopeptide (TPR) repeat protein